MPIATQEEVEITALIRGILNGYPGNSAILREYLQNSDDAKALKQLFILDERVHPSESIIDPALKDSQGPALIAYNDAILQPDDWKALCTIHSSSKQGDEDQTGKNGLGFRASYHLTENPHVLSLQSLMILDPHRAFEKFPGGVTMDIVEEGPAYKDQLVAFSSLFQGEVTALSGTGFRLPFRTAYQAARSKISDKVTHAVEFREMLQNFVSSELESVILFLKHITSIEVRRIDPQGRDSVLGKVEIERLDPTHHSGQVHRKITLSTEDGTTVTRTWYFQSHRIEKAEAAQVLSWRLGYDVADRLVKEKLVPGVEIAFPLEGPDVKGGLFTLLPLPIKIPGSLFHMNAIFALTPDRQNLKKKQEVGDIHSRERLLVEWNTVILEEWAPVAWAQALFNLDPKNLLPRGWLAWPPAEHDPDSYWSGLAHEVTKQIVGRDLPVFPSHDRQRLVSHNSALFARPTDDKQSLFDILSRLGVHIVQPPLQIFSALETIIDNFQASKLSPRSLHNLLRHSPAKTGGLSIDVKAAHQVMEYLALTSSPPTFDLLSDLPWFSRTDGSLVSLTSPPTTPRWIIPATELEAQLFTDDPCILSWDCVSEILRVHFLKLKTMEIVNVTSLRVDLVAAFLISRFSVLDQLSDELPERDELPHIDWLLRFWTWVAQWSAREFFFKTQIETIKHLHLLPTSHKTLRKMSSRVVIFQNIPKVAVKVWGILGVHGLHDSIPRDAVSILQEKSFAVAQGAPGFVSLLIKTYDIDRLPLLDHDSFTHIRESLTSGLRLESEPELFPKEVTKLLQLRVFMVRHHPGGRSTLGPALGRFIFVKLPDDFPLPRLKDDEIVYLDMQDFVTESLIKFVDREGRLKVHNELAVLTLSISNWDLQPIDFQDRVIEKIFENRRHTSMLKEHLKTLNFVTVNQLDHRVPPHGLIHPLSQLAGLYKGEPGRIPTGRFASPDYLVVMQSEGFVETFLNESIIEERLQYFSSGSSDDPTIARKATTFVKLLDTFWKPSYGPFILQMRSVEWFPYDGLSLVAPDQCRDSHCNRHAHPYYYDLCLRVLPGDVVYTPALRSALGWSDAIPSHILLEQLRRTLEQGTKQGGDRLIKLLNYLGQLHSDDKLAFDLEDLKKVVDGRPWIPVMTGPSGLLNIATTKHALLSESELRHPFRRVDPQFKHLPFLIEMGCTIRPTFETLIEELRKSEIAVSAAGRILDEIADHHPGFDRTVVVVPDFGGNMCSIDSVYYRDMNVLDFAGEISEKLPIHKVISQSLAEGLSIPFASSLTLGEDDDEDEQMSEDLVGRICGFLREYDSRYAMNEFLANADDAGATEFSIILDVGDPLDKCKQRLIAPSFESLQGSPSLVLYNNATLSDEDFNGLVRVGRGGKVDLFETHGRHGLGALSFYYFTDVATAISRDTVLILDPSSQYLPPRRHGQKRTSLKRKFVDIARLYPDQLKSYSNLGFSTSLPHFNGTIFILPFRSSIAERPSDATSTLDLMRGSYRELSQTASFFTKLEKISAKFLTSNVSKDLWCLSTTRSPILLSPNELSQCIIDVDGVKEDWIIATSDETPIPALHHATALGLKLRPQSAMKVQLAIKATLSDEKEPDSYLFSTLRLPKTTSLPFHLHSRFAISSNRQSIVFDPADSRNNRDSKTSFNVWILEQLVPPLYLSALEHVLHSPRDSSTRRFDSKRWWLSDRPDEISAVVGAAFGELLPKANNPLFKSVDGRWISFRDAVFSCGENPRITAILRSLKAPGFISSYRRSGITKMASVKLLNAKFVKQVLLNGEALGLLKALYNGRKISAADICSILEYVAEEAPLVGLPLLILSTWDLVQIPAAQTSTVYVSSDSSPAALFSASLFLGQGYSTKVIQHLQADPSISIVALSDKNITTLITKEICTFTTDERRNDWLDLLWSCYSLLPAPQSLEFLENDGLRIIKTSSINLSLPQCLPNQVIFDSAAVEKEHLGSIIKKFAIDILKLDSRSIIGKYLSKRFSDELVVNLLLCLQEKSITSFDTLTRAEDDHLARWLQQNMYQNLLFWRIQDPGIRKWFLLQLPVWSIYRDQRKQRLSASGVAVLPSNFPVEHASSYLRPGRSIASYSINLVGFLEYCQNLRSGNFIFMSARDIMNAVSLPTKVENSAQFDQLEPFIRSMLQLPDTELKQANINLPAGDGTLRRVNELYDHTVPLFVTTLKYTQRPSFLHERFRNFDLHTLRRLGMTHSVELVSFEFCASEIQRLSDQSQYSYCGNRPERQELFEMSRAAFNWYQEELPRQLMTNKAQWARLDTIAFIRPKEVRCRRVSFDWRRYFVAPLPTVLAPSQFVRPSLESIAWTQRHLCFYAPADEVLALNAAFGVPHVSEVVEHLKVLTTQIAQDYPGNMALLSDIRATYKWLDDHSEEAKASLMSAGHLKLFLNVDDPTKDDWTGQWENAQKVVLNLHHDYEHLKSAREFLRKYDNLLRAAGCLTMNIFDRDGQEPASEVQNETRNDAGSNQSDTDNRSSMEARNEMRDEPGSDQWDKFIQQSREVQNEMRKAGILTDMIFVPTPGLRPSSVSMGILDGEYGGRHGIGQDISDGADVSVESDPSFVENVEANYSELRAHRLILAAAIPYFRELATEWKVDNTVHAIPFYGSVFGAKIYLDYVYVGNFDFKSFSPVTMEEEDRLLRDFLDLLQIADQWEMQGLKEKLEWNIIHKFDMIQRLPHANKTMLEAAKRYKATKLTDALINFGKHNRRILDTLRDRDYHGSAKSG